MGAVRRAEPADADDVARLLDAFNREYDEPTPGVAVLAARAARMIESGELLFYLAGEGPDGLAQLQFRASMWGASPDAYLAELYVVPERRGKGLGRALLEAAIAAARDAGAEVIDLNTSDDDVAAIALYERLGFTNLEGGPDGPPMRYYERRP